MKRGYLERHMSKELSNAIQDNFQSPEHLLYGEGIEEVGRALNPGQRGIDATVKCSTGAHLILSPNFG